MEIILHVGAHRTATTSFQHYMRQNATVLRRQRLAFWGPRKTRAGLLAGLLPRNDASAPDMDTLRRRIAQALTRAEKTGISRLIVSEENLLGLPAHNLRSARLYPQAAERMEQVARAFDHRIDRVVMTVRPQHRYWPSAMAYAVQRGHTVPSAAQRDRITRSARGWRDIARDVAACQGAELRVLPFGTTPRATLAEMTAGAIKPPQFHGDLQLNAAPDRDELRAALEGRGADTPAIPAGTGRWQPFDADQRAMLAEAWQDDEFWLAAGGGGIATYRLPGRRTPGMKHQPERAGYHLPPGLIGRGHDNGIEERRMVGSR